MGSFDATVTLAKPFTSLAEHLMDETAIALLDVRKTYGGGVPTQALRGITMSVKRGEFVSVVGPSGSGKSTLLNIMGALDKPTSGKVILAGQDVSRLPDSKLSYIRNRYIGFVFQSYNLVPRMTVLENVMLPLMVRGMSMEEMKRRAMASLREVGILELAGKRPNALSGGQQQRVAIARAVAADPRFILADEPTGNLDSVSSGIVMRLLRRVNRESGKSIVMVTHNMELAKMTDRIVHIRDGLIEKVEEVARDERDLGPEEQVLGPRKEALEPLKGSPEESSPKPPVGGGSS